jgi:hypothetical protein
MDDTLALKWERNAPGGERKRRRQPCLPPAEREKISIIVETIILDNAETSFYD